MKTLSIGTVIVMVVLSMGFILTMGWVNVNPTEVAVQVNKIGGTVTPEPLSVGYHFFNRWKTDMIKYVVSARAYPSDTMDSEDSKKYSLGLKTNDGQNVNVDLTVIYSLDSKQVPQLHQQIGPYYEDQILLPQIRSEARIVIGSYSAEEIYQGKVRDKIQLEIKSKLMATMAKYGAIQIQDALLRHYAFSDGFESAIENKKLAAQQVEINKNLALAQEETAKKQEAEARGLKLQAVQAAQGQAEAVKINADAERYKLEQEAAGTLAKLKAEAEGKRLLTEAMGGGQNVVNLAFAEKISDKLQIWGIPVGQSNTSLMDVSGIFGQMFKKAD